MRFARPVAIGIAFALLGSLTRAEDDAMALIAGAAMTRGAVHAFLDSSMSVVASLARMPRE